MILNRQKKVRIATRPLEAFLRKVQRELNIADAEITVAFVTDAEIAKWNEAYRKKSGPTDVLSFPATSGATLSNGARRPLPHRSRSAASATNPAPRPSPSAAAAKGPAAQLPPSAASARSPARRSHSVAAAKGPASRLSHSVAAARSPAARLSPSAAAAKGPASPQFLGDIAIAPETAQSLFLGDIAIAPETARRYARKNGRTLSAELRVLLLHGLLHLLGYDHESDSGQMDRIEQKLRRKLGIA